MSWWARLFRRRQLDRQLDAELRDHIERQVADYRASGMSEGEARRRAAAAFGGLDQAREYCRDVRGTRWMEDAAQDVRYGVRMLARTPGFTAIAVLSLALGIGANTAIFSLVNSLLLRSLPVRDAEQLVLLDGGSWTNPIWEQIRDRRTELFAGAAAYGQDEYDLSRGGQTDRVEGLWASGEFFDLLGVPAVLGRTFDRRDDRRGSAQAQVAVLSFDFWQRRYGGAGDVIGRTITIQQIPFTIVGVTPPGFFGPQVGRSVDVFAPLAAAELASGPDRLDSRSMWWLEVVARLRPGQSADAATQALRAVQAQLRDATLPTGWPPAQLEQYLRTPLTVAPAARGPSHLREYYQQPLVAVMVVVSLVLLIACANIANLLLARANIRRHELTMRLALGASAARLGRQLVTESLLLSALGAALGILFASWASGLLAQQLDVELDLSLDRRVLAFTIGVAVLTALLFGLAPALRAGRLEPTDALKEHGRGLAGIGRRWLGEPLVVAQIALSLVLLVGAGLFVRTFARMATMDLGFDRDPVLLVSLDVSRAAPEPEARAALLGRIGQAIEGLPGVASHGISVVTPVSGRGWNAPFRVAGLPELAGRERMAFINAVTPGWFATYGTRIVAGRDFEPRDRPGTTPVAIVNEAFARKFLNGENPIGRFVTRGEPGGEEISTEIVGVVETSAYRSVRDPITPTVFLPFEQVKDGPPAASLSVRAATGSPAALVPSVNAALTPLHPALSLSFQPLADVVSTSLRRERVLAILSAFFGGLAMLLAGIGLYVVTSYAVSMRRTEIGVRMALGADAGRVVRLVVARVSWLLLAGVAVGTGLSLWASRYVQSLLFDLGPRDPVTLAGATAALIAIGVAAALLPAWRATRIDPVDVLRES
jgi:putative ABC transport system permease protein